MIHARGLVQTFKTRQGREKVDVRAVDGVDLDVAEGEVVGFLGPNGAGKTTTLRMLTTLLRPTAGTATVAGYDVVKDSKQVRRSIGYVSQAGGVSSYARAGDEVVDHGMLYGLSLAQATKRGQELFEQLDLPGSVAADAQADVRRPEAAPRHRDGPGPRPDPDLPRRADHRARPTGPRQPLGAHRPAAQRSRGDGLPDHPLPRRGRRAQRPHHDHRPGQDHRQRHRREPEGGRLRRPGRPRGRRPRPRGRCGDRAEVDRRLGGGRRAARARTGLPRRPRRTRSAA